MVEVQVPEPARDTSDGAGWMTGHFFGVTVRKDVVCLAKVERGGAHSHALHRLARLRKAVLPWARGQMSAPPKCQDVCFLPLDVSLKFIQ
jgi:hypothetical protein